MQYAAKEFQQALDILDAQEPVSKKLLDRSGKDDNITTELTKDWDMSPASVSFVVIYCPLITFINLILKEMLSKELA